MLKLCLLRLLLARPPLELARPNPAPPVALGLFPGLFLGLPLPGLPLHSATPTTPSKVLLAIAATLLTFLFFSTLNARSSAFSAVL